MSFESIGSNRDITAAEADVLYDSLPEEMKTGYFGFEPQGELFSNKGEAGVGALPHVVVTFADGRRISLHLALKSELSFEKQVEKIKRASQEDQNIKDVELMWQQPVSRQGR
jgi:hypothetical protein